MSDILKVTFYTWLLWRALVLLIPGLSRWIGEVQVAHSKATARFWRFQGMALYGYLRTYHAARDGQEG